MYFWQGENCSIDERGASAIHAARIDNEDLGGSAIQVRVVQGQEPRHFIKMFSGNMVVLRGDLGFTMQNFLHVRRKVASSPGSGMFPQMKEATLGIAECSGCSV